jgi:signal transduction histidine kinase
MNEAAREIAKGHFNKKVELRGADELGQLASSFNVMAQELEKQEQMRGSFVANVSHELKSPMTSIQGFAQGMVDGTIHADEHEKYLTIILDETRRLNKLIRELLDLSQFESGKFSLNVTRFDLNELIRRVVIRYLDRMEEKNIEPEIDFKQDYGYEMADSDRIEQVLVNLVDNAIKFTPDNGQIKIWTHMGQDKIMVSVSDSGCGIPQEDLPYIFDRFFKAHTPLRPGREAGSGLGLTISKEIIAAHGGVISARSNLGKGSTFTFTIPIYFD